MNADGMPHSPNISEAKRSWLSLWLVVHFFILIVCLVQNNGSSFLVLRLHQLTAPYSTALMQDYGARPFEMTTGSHRSLPHRLQVHSYNAAPNQWETIEPAELLLSDFVDRRWRNFEQMLAVAASEKNEELIHVIFDWVAKHKQSRSDACDAVRLVQMASLSFAQNELYLEGKLPIEDLNDSVLYEARIVSMPDSQIRLLPVLEKSRRAASLESAR